MLIRNLIKQPASLTALLGILIVVFVLITGNDQASSQQRQQIIQKIEALVNDEAITAYDVGQRMGLILLATGRTLSSQEELMQLRTQVLESLIDERLEVQEAKELEVPVPEEEVYEVYARVARSYNRTEETFDELLQSYGTSTTAIIQQIEAEYAWQSLVNGRYGSYAEAKDEEIERYLSEMKASEGEREYRISELFLNSPNPSQDERVRETAVRIRERMDGAFEFAEMARQFSQSTSSAQGGDLGWIREDQMAPEILAAVKNMEILDVSEPVKTPGGYYLIALTDRRRIMMPEPMDERLKLRQVGWFFTKETTEESAQAWYDMAHEKAAQFESCENLNSFVSSLGKGAVSRDLGEIPLKQLNPELRDMLKPLPAGSATEPINTPDGFIIFIICERSMPTAALPTREEVQRQIESQRIAMMARRYLRDLRRDAIIEYM